MSSWYNGPWYYQGPEVVPYFVLRIPVQYYRQPPIYFREWRGDAPPRWGDHWGREWEERRGGWDRWDRDRIPRAAPLPRYQRGYSGDRYPRALEQRTIRTEHYQYQPREAVTQQHFARVPTASPQPRAVAPAPQRAPQPRPERPTARPSERLPQQRPQHPQERQPQAQRPSEREPQQQRPTERQPPPQQQRPAERARPEAHPAQPQPQHHPEGHERNEDHR